MNHGPTAHRPYCVYVQDRYPPQRRLRPCLVLAWCWCWVSALPADRPGSPNWAKVRVPIRHPSVSTPEDCVVAQ
jgi:hypothetical protein